MMTSATTFVLRIAALRAHGTSLRSPARFFLAAGLAAFMLGATVGAECAFASAPNLTGTHIRTITYASGPSDPLKNPTGVATSYAPTRNGMDEQKPDSWPPVMFVADTDNDRVVVYNRDTGDFLGTIGGLVKPTDVAVSEGYVFVLDWGGSGANNGRVVVFKRWYWGNPWEYDLQRSNDFNKLKLTNPTAITYTPEDGGRVIILDSGNNRVIDVKEWNPVEPSVNKWQGAREYPIAAQGAAKQFAVNPVGAYLYWPVLIPSPQGNALLEYENSRLYASHLSSGPGQLKSPSGVARTPSGIVLVANQQTDQITFYETPPNPLHRGTLGTTGTANGQFNDPTKIDTWETYFAVADSGNNRVQVFEMADAPFEEGREEVHWDGIACTVCHWEDTRREIERLTDEPCTPCHAQTTRSGMVDYHTLADNVSQEILDGGLASMGSCGTGVVACHAPDPDNPYTEEHQDEWHDHGYHGFDNAALRCTMAQREAGTWAEKATNSCTGTEGGCHSDYSEDSPFWFGSMDIGSAHADYWKHQIEGTVSGIPYTESADPSVGTVDITAFQHGCQICHDVNYPATIGKAERWQAYSTGQAFDCDTCHQPGNGVYAENGTQSGCYRTQYWDKMDNLPQYLHGVQGSSLEGQISGQTMPDSVTAGAADISEYIGSLIDSILSGDGERTAPTPQPVLEMGDLAPAKVLPLTAVPASTSRSLADVLRSR